MFLSIVSMELLSYICFQKYFRIITGHNIVTIYSTELPINGNIFSKTIYQTILIQSKFQSTMNIPLNEFEQHIDEDILKRGLQYFKKGYVTSVDEQSGGEYEAIVEGSDTYIVQLQLKNGSVTACNCTCPYDWGPVCKHEVAVMFYLQQDALGLKAKKKTATKSSPLTEALKTEKKAVKKKKTIQEQLEEILEKLPPEELRGYIGEYCDKDKAFRNLFLAQYLHLIQPVSQDIFSKQIRAVLKSASGRYGYIDYAGARQVGIAIYQLYQLAGKAMTAGNWRKAMYMGCAMLEEMTKAIEHGDDSNGDLGGGIDNAQDILFRIAQECTDSDIRSELFEYSVDAYHRKLFEGWDWHYAMLALAVELQKTEDEKMRILQYLDQIKPSRDGWDFRYEDAQKQRLKLIRKTEGEARANDYLEANISNPDFRRELIVKAIEEKNYDKAISLAEKGITADQRDKPGLADEWKWHLLNVYQLQEEPEKIIEQALYLFLYARRFSTKEMYDIMKKYVPAADWKLFFEQLVAEKIKSERWISFHSIADMYTWEEQWENLLSLLIKYPSLDNIAYVEKHLAKQYAEQLVELYYKEIEDYLEKNVSRGHYKTACKYLRRMNKLGGLEKTEILIAELRTKYKQRRALMEELDKV